MYKFNNKESKKRTWPLIIFVILIIFSVLAFALWYLFIKNTDMSITSFEKVGNNNKILAKPSVEFTTEEFKITLPDKWELLGKQKPYYNQEYYIFQSKVPNIENRWLKVYVNVIPQDFAVNKILPLVVIGNKIQAGEMSGDCKNFKDAPKNTNIQSWLTNWQDVPFVCDLSESLNQVGTGSEVNGYPVTVTGEKSASNNYFFVYTDNNIKPDYKILTNAVNSFIAL